MTSSEHPLAAVLDAAVAGSFPPADGVTELLPPDPWGWSAVVALTGHAYVLADIERAVLDDLGADGYGGASHPDVLRRIAGPGGEIGSLDAMLVGPRRGPGPLLPPAATTVDDHPRVRRARDHRRDVEVYGDDAGLVVARPRPRRAPRDGRRAARPGRRRRRRPRPPADPRRPRRRGPRASRCWAQVSPGNAQSLRAFLACGFVPIGSEVLIRPAVLSTRDGPDQRSDRPVRSRPCT